MSKKFLNKYRIESARASWHDYAKNGAYYITICTAGRRHYFGKIENRLMVLTEIGKQAQQKWLEIPIHFAFVKLDEFVVMPNHFHGIIVIDNPGGDNKTKNLGDTTDLETGNALSLRSRYPQQSQSPTQPQSPQQSQSQPPSQSPSQPQNHPRFRNQGKNTVSAMVGSYKSAVTKYCNENNLVFGCQSRFHDHIIRNDADLHRIRNYILQNPRKWNNDKFY